MPEEKTLSEREKDVLRLVALGLTNREIGQELVISPNTVKVHLSNIYEKIGVVSRTEATVYAIEHRIVEVPGRQTFGNQSQPRVWRQLTGLWIAIGLLVVTILLTVFFNVFPSTITVEPQPTADLSETWETLAPMPEARSEMAVVVYSDELFVIAGTGLEGVTDSVYRYLPEDDTWHEMEPKPTAVSDIQGVLIGERIYVPGGKTISGDPIKTLEIYDPRRDSWEEGADLPSEVSGYALVAYEGLLYLFGVWNGEETIASVWIYDPNANHWSQGTPMDFPRNNARAIALSDRIVVLGGKSSNGKLKSEARAYFPSRDATGENPWEDFADLPEGRVGFGAASINDSIYVIGGEVTGKGESGLFIIENAWMALPTQVNFSGNQTELAALDSLLYVLQTAPGENQTGLWAYHAYYFSIYIPFVP